MAPTIDENATVLTFPKRILTASFFITMVAVIWIGGYNYSIYYTTTRSIDQYPKLESLIFQMGQHDDARDRAVEKYILTQNPEWQKKYARSAFDLQKTIEEISLLSPDLPGPAEDIKSLRSANEKMSRLEKRAFEMIQGKRRQAAGLLLDGEEYRGIQQAYHRTMHSFYDTIERSTHEMAGKTVAKLRYAMYLVTFALFLLGGVWFQTIHNLGQWQSAFEETRRKLAERYAEKENMEQQMRHYIDDVKAAHSRAMRAMNEAERADRAKSEFLANMSHELRTPMNGIIGMAGMLEETELTEDQNEYCTVIARSAKSLLLIVNDILDLSKIEAGSMEIESKPFALRKVLADTIELFLPLASEKGIILTAELGRSLPRFVDGDEGRFIQILRNLIGNAIKFTDEGGVHLTALMKTNGALYFSVRDTGIGIPPEQVGRIFDKFTQANATTTRRYGGTGLGLAISKQLTEMMGGQIGVESILKEGSNFWFELTLPIREDIEDIVERFIPRTATGRIDTSHLDTQGHILLVEDHPTNQLLMKRLLEKLGFRHIDMAENGREALEKFDKKNYDIVLMDCQMPEMDGYEATGWIRKLEEGSERRIPVIAMTANAMVGDREKCLDAGMDDYISKPIDASRFSNLLMQWMPKDDGVRKASNDAEVPEESSQKLRFANKISSAPVNVVHLESFTDGDQTIERELFGVFLEQAERSFEQMESAVEDEGSDEVWRSTAHRFKGAAANLGAGYLSEVCLAAEKGFQKSPDEKREILGAMRSRFAEVRDFLEARTG